MVKFSVQVTIMFVTAIYFLLDPTTRSFSSILQRLLGIKMATFRLQLVCRWSPDDFEVYREGLDLSDVESS